MPDKNEKDKRNGKWADLVEKCLEAYETIGKSDYRQLKIDSIKRSHTVYEQIEEPTDFPWDNAYNIILPLLTITVDNVEPRIVSSVVGREPYLQFNMKGMSEPDDLAVFLEEWFNAELKEVVELENETKRICHNLLLEGTVYPVATYYEDKVVRTDFVYDENNQPVIDPETGNAVTEDIEDSIFQGGRIEYVNFNDIYVEDDIDDWEKADIIRVVRPTYADLKEWAKDEEAGYMNIGPWLLGEEKVQDEGSPVQEEAGVEFTGRETIECLEYHVHYVYKKEGQAKEDIDDWERERYVALIARDSETIIRLKKLREINYQNEHVIKRIRIFPERGRSYGNSLYDKMKSIQNGASDTFNILMNTAYICILPWFLYSNRTGLPEDMTLHPGKGVQVDDPSSVVFPKFSVNPAQFMTFFDVWLQLWERLGSIGDLQIGKPSQKAETATETMQVIQEGNIKHNYQSSVFKEEFLDLLRTIYDLYYKNMPFDKSFYYQGREIVISRNAMRRPYTFRLTGSTDLSNKVMELRKTEQLYMMLRQDPLVNAPELVKDVIESFKPECAPDQYLNPEIMQVINQYMMQKQAEAEMAQQQQQAQQVVQSAQNAVGGVPPQ